MQLMKVRCLIAVTLLSVVTGLCGSCAKEAEEPSAEAEEVQWLTSFDEALKAAQKKNQPVMIDFYAEIARGGASLVIVEDSIVEAPVGIQ